MKINVPTGVEDDRIDLKGLELLQLSVAFLFMSTGRIVHQFGKSLIPQVLREYKEGVARENASV